jgi:mRNA-degrading endonuclease toxin of MazEF toxin-antitoxin module
MFMTDVLTWTIERRLELAKRAELLRKELGELELEVVRLEAAEVVFGQWSEATDGGRRPPGIVSPEPEPEPVAVTVGPGAGGMRVVPDRVEGMRLEALTSGYRRIMEIVAGADGPVMARNVALALGRETTPAKIEPVRGQLRKLSDRGWLVRTASGRYRPR